MVNGYAMFSRAGLEELNAVLQTATADQIDAIRSALRIGVHWRVQVTLQEAPADHHVTQAYCSALPVAYHAPMPMELWRPFASLILEASYEATLLTGIVNHAENGCDRVYLTRVGGGAFGNEAGWIASAMRRGLRLVRRPIRVVASPWPTWPNAPWCTLRTEVRARRASARTSTSTTPYWPGPRSAA
jgi:hypothetical protein